MAKGNFSLISIIIISVSLFDLTSCKKSLNPVGDTSIPLIGGFLSSDSVEPKSLIAYWPFDNNSNEKIGGLIATRQDADYTKGIRLEAFLGVGDNSWDYRSYDPVYGVPLEVPLAASNTTFDSLHSYSVSIWFNAPYEVATINQGLFHIHSIHRNLIELEFEPYSTSAGDKLKVHVGFTNPGGIAYKEIITEGTLDSAFNRWVHLVMTYNGSTSLFTLYQNAVPIALSASWTQSNYSTSPIPIWTDGSATVPMGNIDFASDIPQGITIGSFPISTVPDSSLTGLAPVGLDELRIFNISITQKDVTGLYLNGLKGR